MSTKHEKGGGDERETKGEKLPIAAAMELALQTYWTSLGMACAAILRT